MRGLFHRSTWLIAVLLALAGVLAAPAFAVSLRSAASTPCHEVEHAGAPALHGDHSGTTEPEGRAPPSHPCCVLACLIAAPLPGGPGLALFREAVDWDAIAGPIRRGREPALPDPPPRRLS